MAGAAPGGGQVSQQLQQLIDSAPQGNPNIIQAQGISEPAYYRPVSNLTMAPPPTMAPSGQPQNYAQQSLGNINQAAMATQGLVGFRPGMIQAGPAFQPQNIQAGPAYQAQQIQGGSAFTPERISAQQIGSRDVNAERVAAERVAAGQLAQTSLDPYMNPFTSQVVETTLGDLERQRQIQQQGTAAQAARAGAFGGSRQGVAESLTNEAFARQAAQTAAGLRQAGFTQAQQQAQQDIQRRLEAARLNQATGLQASLANQATGLQAQTANQRAALEAARANQQAALEAARANQATGLQAGLAGQQLDLDRQRLNQAASLQAGLAGQSRDVDVARLNQAAGLQAGLAGQARDVDIARLNQAAQLQGAQFGLGAARQLGALGQDRFAMGQTVESQIQAQERESQRIQQILADRARNQFLGFTGEPARGLGYLSGALGATPGVSTTTQSRDLGAADYLALASYFSDSQLKDDIEEVKTLPNGIKVVRWKWNDLGKKLADQDQPTYGVIAQQIADIIPEAVKKHVSGYLMVDYSHPELRGI